MPPERSLSVTKDVLFQASFYLAFASAVAILLSIAVSHILLGMSLAALFGSRAKLRMPPVWLPLALFCLGTLVSMAFSPEPWHALSQVKKMYVFTMLLVIFTTMRATADARRLMLFWSGVGGAVSCLALVQFALKVQQAHAQHRDFYEFYNANRITGTMSHWMTFAGQEMVVLLMLTAFLLFAPAARRWPWFLCAALLAAAELLNETRTAWFGLAAAAVWLLWAWKRWMVLAVPLAAVLMAVVPGPVHERFNSILHPKRDLDSNGYRWLAVRTGARMIEAHPLLGIGPDETKYHFRDWMPPDRPEPLPSGYYQHLENLYLQYAAERGIPVLLTMLWLFAMVIYDFLRRLRHLPPGPSDERFLLQGGIATVVGIMVSGLGEVNLGDTEVLTVFLVVVACGYLAVPGSVTDRFPVRPSGDQWRS